MCYIMSSRSYAIFHKNIFFKKIKLIVNILFSIMEVFSLEKIVLYVLIGAHYAANFILNKKEALVVLSRTVIII